MKKFCRQKNKDTIILTFLFFVSAFSILNINYSIIKYNVGTRAMPLQRQKEEVIFSLRILCRVKRFCLAFISIMSTDYIFINQSVSPSTLKTSLICVGILDTMCNGAYNQGVPIPFFCDFCSFELRDLAIYLIKKRTVCQLNSSLSDAGKSMKRCRYSGHF